MIPRIGVEGYKYGKHFPYLYPSTPILFITSTLYAYEDGTDSKFRNVATKSSDAGRLSKRQYGTVYHLLLVRSIFVHRVQQTGQQIYIPYYGDSNSISLEMRQNLLLSEELLFTFQHLGSYAYIYEVL